MIAASLTLYWICLGIQGFRAGRRLAAKGDLTSKFEWSSIKFKDEKGKEKLIAEEH